MRKVLVFLLLTAGYLSPAQYLSNLQATKNDALFATYAAPLSRSSYKLDQGYQFSFNDPEGGVEMISADGPNFGLAFALSRGVSNTGSTLAGSHKVTSTQSRFRLKELFKEPTITVSYSDVLKYFYYPFEHLRTEVCFDVYSSSSSFMEVQLKNESSFGMEITIMPYQYYPSADTFVNLEHNNLFGAYSYPLKKKADSWMKEHNIPFATDLRVFYTPGLPLDSLTAEVVRLNNKSGKNSGPAAGLQRYLTLKSNPGGVWQLFSGFRTIRLEAGESTRFRVLVGIQDAGCRLQDGFRALESLKKVDPEQLVKDDEFAYSKIPKPVLPSEDYEMLYWSCFSLMRQCMMPAEGKCRTNYYVFSREPKWGWGYGGQVFHESLSMLTYVYMDPASALNSQRVYIQRQQPDGYINYRSGPYLDETIPYEGKNTTSAPWYNYINWELYKATADKKFLAEAYNSGKKFYSYFVRNRDANRNGLCEWGAEGELESVRDARVAVWDLVGRPMNFEGPDVNAMLVMEAKSLSAMAKELGFKSEEKLYADLASQRSALVEKYLWDPETEFYYNVYKENQSFTFRKQNDLKIREIIGFLPLWAGISSKERASDLMKTMRDPLEFGRPFGIPTLSASSDYYNPIGYWNGPVWVQWEYLMYRGLNDYGYKKDASQLLSRVLDNMIWHLKKDHVFWEFYSADDRQAGWNKTYIWAGIAARMLLDEYGVPMKSLRVVP